ncbi:hypothetical protein JD969_12195 [Planctomycetota bacterium]|nr:hypothetical protein JD969_12195 [Planctomycetota bacterium]
MPQTVTQNIDSPITHNLHCINCNYNLRTLTSTQSCPECDHPIQDTLKQPYLCFAPLPYLKSLRFFLLNILIAPLLIFSLETAQGIFFINISPQNIQTMMPWITTFLYAYIPLQSYLVLFVIYASKKHPYRPIKPKLVLTLHITAITSIIMTGLQISFFSHPHEPFYIYLATIHGFIQYTSIYLTYILFFLFLTTFSLGYKSSKHITPIRYLALALTLCVAIFIPIHFIAKLFYSLYVYKYNSGYLTTFNPHRLLTFIRQYSHYTFYFIDITLIGSALLYTFLFRRNITKLINSHNQTS